MPDQTATLLLAIDHVCARRLPEAEQVLQDVLAAEPDNPHALFMLGDCALLGGRAAEASALLARALSLRPAHRDTRLALARALLTDARPQEALDALAPLAGDVALAAAHRLRGNAFSDLGRPAEAVEAYERSYAVDPNDAEAQLNGGNAYADLDEAGTAEYHIRRAIALQPEMAEAHASLGHLLTTAGRVNEAVDANAAAIALQPDLAVAHWNQGVALLLNGDMAAGWDKYEWRKRHFPGSFGNAPGPQWDGEEALTGRTILVIAEQGFGDTIQFARYLPLLARRGAQVVVECAASVAGLLSTQPGVAAASARGRRPAYDFWVDQMSLPRLFGTRLDNIPYPAGYLVPDSARAARWQAVLPNGLRVGLAWAGNPLHSNDRRRSMPAGMLSPIIAAGRSPLVSLQTGPRARDMARLFGVNDYSARLTDWAETAAAISVLDLVITVDTAVAHLAGALGIPAWVMLPQAPDWRWMLGRPDSPWYRSMRLFAAGAPWRLGGCHGTHRRRAVSDDAAGLRHGHAAIDVERGAGHPTRLV